jgi:hypothetical protein
MFMGDFDDYGVEVFIGSVSISKYDGCYVLTHLTQNVCITDKYLFMLVFNFNEK